jgi:hypothetical protein
MYSLSIHFGPNNVVWALLFKEKENAGKVYNAFVDAYAEVSGKTILLGVDDFGQSFAIPSEQINGVLLEDLDLVETARIQRSLADERTKAKFIQAATNDPTIKAAMRPQGTPVLTPQGGFGRGF